MAGGRLPGAPADSVLVLADFVGIVGGALVC